MIFKFELVIAVLGPKQGTHRMGCGLGFRCSSGTAETGRWIVSPCLRMGRFREGLSIQRFVDDTVAVVGTAATKRG